MKLHVHEDGTSGPVVVLLHGFGGNHLVWAGLQPMLARRARTMAYDLPGHGRSWAFPDAGPPRLAARAILEDLSQRGVARAHLVGHSMGGAVAMLAALLAPERVASATLLAPGGFGAQIDAGLLARFATAREAGEIRACLQAMHGPDSEVTEEEVEATLVSRPEPGQTVKLAEIAALITKGGRQGEIPRAMMAQLALPVSVVWGTADKVLPVTHAHDLPPRFALHLVPGCGHMIPQEAADVAHHVILRNAGLLESGDSD